MVTQSFLKFATALALACFIPSVSEAQSPTITTHKQRIKALEQQHIQVQHYIENCEKRLETLNAAIEKREITDALALARRRSIDADLTRYQKQVGELAGKINAANAQLIDIMKRERRN